MRGLYRTMCIPVAALCTAWSAVDGICLTSAPEHAHKQVNEIPGTLLAFEPLAGRHSANLGGTWGFIPAETIRTPPDKGWKRITISRLNAWERNHWGKHNPQWKEATCGWYLRRFSLPPKLRGRILILSFGAVHAEADVMINGESVGNHVGGLTPFQIDITNHVHWDGINELLVGCRGPLAKGIQKQPRGAMYRFHAGIWQAVHLTALPEVHLSRPAIRTSVRNMHLTVKLQVHNAGADPVRVRVEGSVAEPSAAKSTGPNAPALTLPPVTLRLDPGQTRHIEMGSRWPGARLWSPHNPSLYTLTTRLTCPGQPGDVCTERFGFREFRIDGPDFRLNGVKTRLKATWGHSGEWYYGRPKTIRETLEVLKAHNVNTVRFHGQPMPPTFLDAADEVGMLVVAESALYHSPVHENSLIHTREWVLRDRNHPSIVIWSGSNEFGHWIVPRDPERTRFLLRQEALIRELDPTRPVMQHGYGPMDGHERVYNIHYPERALAMLPNTFYWPIDHSLQINPAYEGFAWQRKRPLAIGEHLLGNTGKASLFVGDTAYGQDRDWEFAARLFGVAMDSYRICGIAHVAPQVFASSPGGKSVPNPFLEGISEVFRPEGIILPRKSAHVWPGEHIEKRLFVYNETPADRTYRVRWESDRDPPLVQGGNTELLVPAGECTPLTIALDIPDTPAEKRDQLRITLLRTDRDSPVETTSLPLRIVPPPARLTLRADLALYDPRGTTERALRSLGVTHRRVRRLDGTELAGADVLVLGEGAVTADFANWAPGLESFVEAGGRLVCMAQTTMPRWLPLPVALCGKNASPTETSVFVRAAPHPVTRGFDLESLRFWRDDHVVVRRSLLKPKKGNAIPIADSNLDLVHSPLLELPHGKGVYLLCQALAVEAFEREPMAPVLLANLLEYADTRPQSKWVKTAVMADRDSPLVRALRDDLKADFACIEPTGVLPATHALIVIDAQALVNCNPDRLRHRVDMGATVLVQAVCPDARGALASLLEEDVQVTKAETRPVRFVADQPETVGLSNFDLDWKDKSGRRLSHSRLEYTVHVSSDAATDLTDLPGSLFRVVRGTGRVLVNQFRWPTERHDSEAAQRFASILLTNLGVPMTSLSLVPVSAKGWFFVDIAPFCNARLRHASGNDLRDLPTGQTEFRDIPFFVMPHDRNHGLGAMHLDNVLALDDGTVLGKKDAPVTELRGIRVRKHVGRMAFLHAAGFNHGLARYQKPRMAEYIINYRGGSREVVPVRAGKEVVNWWTDWAADLPNAKLAWKGANLKTDNIAVFMTEWANPFPERLVETVDFVSCSNPAWGPTCIAISGLEIE